MIRISGAGAALASCDSSCDVNDVVHRTLCSSWPRSSRIARSPSTRELADELPPVAPGSRPVQAGAAERPGQRVRSDADGRRADGDHRGARTRRVWVEICDDGVGVDPAILDRVFDPFVSTKREGVGLGLVNAKAVVEGHGGRISLAARQPRGTCALITLPVPNALDG